MIIMRKEDAIKEVIENMSNEEKIGFYQDYAGWYDVDDYIYPMYDLNELFCDVSFTDAISKIDLPNFDFNDDYIIDTVGYGALRSGDESEVIDIVNENIDYIIEKIIDDENSLYNDDIQEILDMDDNEIVPDTLTA